MSNGAGRPKGSTNLPKIRDYITEEEVKELVLNAKEKAKEGDVTLLKFLVEQIFGKAPQNIEVPGEKGEIKITWES